MAFVVDKVSEDTFYENILLGLTKLLERNPQIKNVYLERVSACPLTEVALWEQMHGLRLPVELRDFYLASNGMCLTWNYYFSGTKKHDDVEILTVGLLKIRSISELSQISKANLQVPAELKSLKKLYQHCNAYARVFYLANVDDTAKVCLVYTNNSRIPPHIYLVENDNLCYFLTNSFKKYLLIAIAHLGLPLWQYCFTPQGPPTWVEQMFIINAPHLEVCQPVTKLLEDNIVEDTPDLQNCQVNKLDSNIFKTTKHRSSKNLDISKATKKHKSL